MNCSINLLDQLSQLAYCSHLLLFIFRKWGTKFITKDLYLDLQSTIQDAFLVTEVFNRKNKNENVYLYQCGTDEVEGVFRSLRTLTHSSNCDILELHERMSIVLQIESVLNDHPNWRQSSRLSETKRDHSSVGSWTGKLNTTEISKQMLKYIWKSGYDKSIQYLKLMGYSDKDLTIKEPSVNVLKPHDIMTSNMNVEADCFENDLVLESDEIEELISLQNNSSESNFEKMIEIDGKLVHKANAVSSLIHCLTKLSNKRQTRVFGISDDKLIVESNVNQELEDCIVITDILYIASLAINTSDNCLMIVAFSINKIHVGTESRQGVLENSIKESSFSGTTLLFTKFEDDQLVWQSDYGVDLNDINGCLCCKLRCDVKMNDENKISISILISELKIIKEYFEILVNQTGNESLKIPKLKLPFDNERIYNALKLKNDLNPDVVKDKGKDILRCKVIHCQTRCKRNKMRLHIAKHILNKDINASSSLCGFCGSLECISSGSSNSGTSAPKSNCKYFYSFSLACVVKSTKTSPCTNRPVYCPHCPNQVYWSYNLQQHYKDMHPLQTCNLSLMPTSDAIKKVLMSK